MNLNYSAWDINEKDFPTGGSFKKKMEFLLGYAILAPSAHNTQPWNFEIGDSFVEIFLDNERVLGYSDSFKRQSYESLGAFLETFLIALDHFNYSYIVDYIDNNGLKIKVSNIMYKNSQSINEVDQGIFDCIKKRSSAKLDYLDEPVGGELLNKLNDLVGNSDNLKIYFVDRKDLISKIADIVAHGTEEAFLDKNFTNELSEWVRHTWTKSNTGMPAHTMGMPKVLTLLASILIKRVDLAKTQAKMARKTVLATPVVGLICGENNMKNWLDAGRIFVRESLCALNYGFSTSIMGAPIESESASEMLTKEINLEGKPILFFRIGKQKGKRIKSPRYPISYYL